MPTTIKLRTVVLSAAVALTVGASIAVAEDRVDFNRDVRPILSNACFTCHGPDENTREAGLRLDRRDTAVQELDSGLFAVVPGDSRASELIRRVTSDNPDQRMPPADSGKSLNDEQISTLTRWIEQGAEYQMHWSFVAPRRVEIPQVKNVQWAKNDVDNFVLANLERQGLSPAAEATRETLIRRVAFDVTGLPPTLAEIDAFLADDSPQAYERMVDRYLESPAYGEHMARHWLDLARYADTNGYQYDTEREQWVWRDWVIDAYNHNKPFDQFTIEQLAGDLLPDATAQQRLATGFNRNHGITIEGGIIDEEYRVEYVMDRLVTTGDVWLGLTIGCARCHDHKFDPLSQQEFYQLFAYFNQVPERGNSGFDPREKIASPLAADQQRDTEAELADLRVQLQKPVNVDEQLEIWARRVSETGSGWQVVEPTGMKSSGGSTFTKLDDHSVLVGGANPNKDVYEITARTDQTNLTAIRLEALVHPSLPGGGPGRHSNSNFVLSEFELTAASLEDPEQSQQVKFTKAIADYSQTNYEIDKAIDGTTAGSNGWAVDGPTRKVPATAIFIAGQPFGYEGGTELRFTLRHEAGFATHGVGRPRLSITRDDPAGLQFDGIPADLRSVAATPPDQRDPQQAARLREYFVKHHGPQKAIEERIAALEKRKSAAYPATMVMRDMPTPRATFVLNRGQYNEPTKPVEPGVPAIFPPLSEHAPANRLGLAQWLFEPDHPLTARVAVNRYWQRLFGIGLVKTSEDFGVQGELPSHPELLDWLAVEFRESGWNVKQVQRLMLTSATYRQSSHVGSEAYRRDPQNRLLARGPRMRLDAEEIRDGALAASGLLVTRLGGKSVYPYQPDGLWMELNNRPGYSKEYEVGKGDDLFRRSLYTFWKRTVPSPMLKTLDAPEREFCTLTRSRTNTPLQSLLLLNGPQFVEAARHLAARMMQSGGTTIDQRIEFGFRLVASRGPSADEIAVIRATYESALERFAADPTGAGKLLSVGDSPRDATLDSIQHAAWTTIGRLLLNLDEFITKG